nr:hypothetical protein [Streptomyces antimycoticus]
MSGLDDGVRHQVFLTDTPYGEGALQHLEVRHRNARVEDRARCGNTTGFGRDATHHFPQDMSDPGRATELRIAAVLASQAEEAECSPGNVEQMPVVRRARLSRCLSCPKTPLCL